MSALPRRWQRAGLWAVLTVTLGAVSTLSVPMLYDHGNGGRYLLQVLQAADPELFPNDPAVVSLARFGSLFYELLAGLFALAARPPEELEGVLRALYPFSRAANVLLALALARSLTKDAWPVLVFAVWACFKKGAPVGGEALFAPVMNHATVAFLLGGAALLALLRERRLVFWGLLGLALFVHSLVALHLVACLVPVLLLRRRGDLRRTDGIGGGLFVACLVLYSVTLAPPPMSPEEGRIFLEAKGGMRHVSPFAQSGLDWLVTAATLGLALAAGRSNGDRSRGEKLLAEAIVAGALVATAVSFAAVSFAAADWGVVRLVQFQPLRIFGWVHVMSYLLLSLAAVRALERRTPTAPFLVGVVVFSIFPTRWQLPMLGLAGLGLLAEAVLARRDGAVRGLALAALGGTVALIGAGWLGRDAWSSLETLRNPWPPFLALLLLGLAGCQAAGPRFRRGALAVVLAAACLGSAQYWHRYFDARAYPEWGSVFKDRRQGDWKTVRQWIAANTAKEARFLVAGCEANFRTRALRTGLGEPMSALAWVDPRLHLENAARFARVEAGRREDGWDLHHLAALAEAWDARYLVVRGAVDPAGAQPLVRIGSYRVFDLERFIGSLPGGSG